MLFDDEDETTEESLPEDLVSRVEEAQFAIAWAVRAYRELYGQQPKGKTWCEMMESLVAAKNSILSDLSDHSI